jgi:hypothetical protein
LADDRRDEDFFAAERVDDFFADDFFADRRRPPLLLVSPASRRCLFTVAAAMRLAVALLRPCFFAEALIFSYCRVRFALFTPRGGIGDLLAWALQNVRQVGLAGEGLGGLRRFITISRLRRPKQGVSRDR